MRLFSFAGAVALAIVASAPASAALFTYEFSTAQGGASGSITSNVCTMYSCTTTQQGESNLTLSGSFTVDTSKLPNDQYGGGQSFHYDIYQQPVEAQFLTTTATHTGTLDVGSGTGGGRSYLNGSDGGTNNSFFQAYVSSIDVTFGTQFEYRADGSLERSYYRDEYFTFYLYDDFDVSQIDGMDLATALPLMISSGYAQMGFYTVENFYDENSQYTGRNESYGNVGGSLATMNAHPGGPTTVPEPAMLALFGLGFMGLAAARRRKAA